MKVFQVLFALLLVLSAITDVAVIAKTCKEYRRGKRESQ